MDLSIAIQAVTALAAVLAAVLAWMSYRTGRHSLLLNLPHLTARKNRPGDALFRFWLEGPGADEWEVDLLQIAAPKSVEFLGRVEEQDSHGGQVFRPGERTGPVLIRPLSPAILSAGAEPVTVKARLRLKANPRVRSWRTVIVGQPS
jgi:hypothetical protein